MKNTITEALIYEAQGLKDDALIVYKNILKREPTNAAAIAAIRRLSGLSRKKTGVNEQVRRCDQETGRCETFSSR